VSALYFAYGSNLAPERMRERVGAVRTLGVAQLAGFCLRIDKRGTDGSGKANLREDAQGRVWGVLYAFEAEVWPRLDACEPGYERVSVSVECGGAPHAAHTYRSHLIAPDLLPLAWYKRMLVDGARAQGLPDAWLQMLEALPERG
jgi:gamma-glutamylcyclotransferase